WMRQKRTLEIAVLEPPMVHPDFPNSVWIAERLKTCMEDGRLKLWRLPVNFDPKQWPRAIVNPDKSVGLELYSTSLVADGFLDLPLPTPLWKGPSPPSGALAAMRSGWVALDAKVLRLPKDTSLVTYSAGEARDLHRDFGFCSRKAFALIRLEDPF